MAGLFISFEGVDGAGKTLQTDMLKNYFETKAKDVILIREPGSTSIGEQIREIIIDKKNTEMHNYTEALLYTAARAQLVYQVILPALEAGKIVICDRFLDSSLVYQGKSRNLGVDFIKNLNESVIKDIMPEITFLINVTPEVSFARKNKSFELDRLELESRDFFEKVYNGYLEIANNNKDRIKVIDGTQSPELVHKAILAELEKSIKNY